MKFSHTLLICACLVFVGVNFSTAVTPTPAPAPQQRVQGWEYLLGTFVLSTDGAVIRTVDLGNGKPKPYGGTVGSDQLGADGWELVSVHNQPDRSNRIAVMTFKRPKR